MLRICLKGLIWLEMKLSLVCAFAFGNSLSASSSAASFVSPCLPPFSRTRRG